MLKVNEVYGPTIQGEGKNAGKPVMFIRLAICNLHCIWCDTPETWNWKGTKFAHPKKFSKLTEISYMDEAGVFNQLRRLSASIKHIVISGGEPLIQQKRLVPLLELLKQDGYFVEIETNGTISPIPEFTELVDQINISIKLENSTNTVRQRRKHQAIIDLFNTGKAVWKFVVSEFDDVNEILSLTRMYNMYPVYLMGEGITVQQLKQKEDMIRGLCSIHKWFYAPRLHIEQFGDQRRV